MAPLHRGFRHLPRARRVDTAGINLDCTALAAEQLPKRSIVSLRVKVPEREIDSGDGLREWACLAGLQRKDGSAFCQLPENS